jgi:hypothetical protein
VISIIFVERQVAEKVYIAVGGNVAIPSKD